MVGQVCSCPPPVDQAGWAHEWLESCPIHGAAVRDGVGKSKVFAPTTAEINQAGAAAIERELMSGKEYSMSVDCDEALAEAVIAAVTPLIEVRCMRQAAVALRSNMGADELPEPGDRLDRWANNAMTAMERMEPRGMATPWPEETNPLAIGRPGGQS